VLSALSFLTVDVAPAVVDVAPVLQAEDRPAAAVAAGRLPAVDSAAPPAAPPAAAPATPPAPGEYVGPGEWLTGPADDWPACDAAAGVVDECVAHQLPEETTGRAYG
jgi:hypothetical protein